MKHMLSARQQAMSEKPPSDQESAGNGFARVLNSLQGLQQRLDDFSVEEVSRAHARTLDLIRDLDGVQRHLNVVKAIKQAGATASAALDAQPAMLAELIESPNDGLDDHPRLRALVQAGKLVERYRTLIAARITDPALSTSQAELLPAIVPAGLPRTKANTLPLTARPETKEKANEPKGVDTADPPESENAVGFILLSAAGRPNHFKKKNSSAESRTPESGSSGAGRHDPAPRHAFDERLLKDLIDTYGELSVFEKSATTKSSSERSGLAARFSATEQPKHVPPAPEPPQVPAVATQRAMTTLAPEPAFVKEADTDQLALPAPNKENFFDSPAAHIKARGEIDRQLKSIIKDYGEVDLYSHRDTVTFKSKAIAAAGLLALVLAGFYFFIMPSSTSNNPNEPAAVSTRAASGDMHRPPQQK